MTNFPESGYTPKNLRHFIAQHGLLQREVAKILGVSDSIVRKWLADVHLPSHRDMPLEKWLKLLAWQPAPSGEQSKL